MLLICDKNTLKNLTPKKRRASQETKKKKEKKKLSDTHNSKVDSAVTGDMEVLKFIADSQRVLFLQRMGKNHEDTTYMKYEVSHTLKTETSKRLKAV